MPGRTARPNTGETLAARPWAECPCAVCQALGVHVVLFRGAERNRRRGFHNLFVTYRRLQAKLRRRPAPPRPPAAKRKFPDVKTPAILRVPALEVRQGRSRVLYSFAVDGKLLPRFASVSRITREDQQIAGYQRPEVLSHIAEIRTYLESDNPLIPNAIVVAFDKRVKFEPLGWTRRRRRLQPVGYAPHPRRGRRRGGRPAGVDRGRAAAGGRDPGRQGEAVPGCA